MNVCHARSGNQGSLIRERILRVRHGDVDDGDVPGRPDGCEVIGSRLPRGRDQGRQLHEIQYVIHNASLSVVIMGPGPPEVPAHYAALA